ncbi:hypothetical protein ACFT9I_05890 [Streptomyces sp. NPDC057137]|uniref:hypothetical protein n=1 Tax=Streptomyces sp. NPDC057137 TaxID=3346030 RepID=UPI00363F2943
MSGVTISGVRRAVAKPFAVGVAIVALGVGAGVAWAAVTDNIVPIGAGQTACHDEGSMPDGKALCQSDNAGLSYYMDSGGTNALEEFDKTVVRTVMEAEFEPTDLSVGYDSTPAFSGAAETDIVYEESGIGVGSGSVGTTFCNDAVDSLRCDQTYIRILGGGEYDYGTTCHETGHGVGLTHGDQAHPQVPRTDSRLGCLANPAPNSAKLGANNRDNINLTY